MKCAVVNFLGSNCLAETIDAFSEYGFDTCVISQDEKELDDYNLIVLPGGFSYGDYISCGRIAKFSCVIGAIKEKIKKRNTFILGICNGFQILTEASILPGALIENIGQKFICNDVELEFMNKTFSLPIAHHQGRFYIDDIKQLDDFELIKYKKNPNGSMNNIAGLYDKKNYIMGLMPHPERNFITPFKNGNGKIIFDFISEKIYEII